MKKTVILSIAIAGLLILWILYRETESFFKTGSKTNGTTAVENTNWISYSSPTGLFSVNFPNAPEYKSEIERDADGFAKRTNETYVAEDANKNLYVIYFIRYLAEEQQIPLPPNTLLNNLMYEILDKHKGSQLLSFKKVNFKGRNALEFSIDDHGLTMNSLAFINNSDLYLLSTIGKQNSITSHDFQKFTNSFDFKD